MKRTFKSEDSRKDRLFDAWIEHLRALHATPDLDAVEEIYEGMAIVTDVGAERLGVQIRQGEVLVDFPVSARIGKHTVCDDHMFVALGRIGDRWWPLDVISIGSIVRGSQTGIHFTVNPLYHPGMGGQPRPPLGRRGSDQIH